MVESSSNQRRLGRWRRIGILCVLLVVCIALGLAGNWEYIPGTFHRGEFGLPLGSGTELTYYDSGSLMCKQLYKAGFCYKAIWYGLDGEIVAESNLDKSNGGTWYYLYQDGKVRAEVPCRYDSLSRTFPADGMVKYFAGDGSLTKVLEFRDGLRVYQEADANPQAGSLVDHSGSAGK